MQKKIAGLILASVFIIQTAQAAVIDDFNGGVQNIDAPSTNTTSYANSIGNYRTIDITKTGILGVAANVIPVPGLFSHSADSLTSGISTITWDANGNGLGGLNLVEGLINNLFNIDILSIDQGEIDLILKVEDIFNHSYSVALFGATIGVNSIAYSQFHGVDFTLVDLVSLEIVGQMASDLTLDSIETSGNVAQVSEPGPMTLIGLGFSIIGFQYKLRSKQNV